MEVESTFRHDEHNEASNSNAYSWPQLIFILGREEVRTMAKAKVKPSKRGEGVCAFGRELIRQGKTNAQVLAACLKKFPQSSMKIGSVGWLRADMIKKGEKVKTNAQVTAKAA